MHWPATTSRSVVSHASTVVRVTTTERLPVHDRTARCRHAIVAKFPPSSPIVAYAISFVSVACIASSEKTVSKFVAIPGLQQMEEQTKTRSPALRLADTATTVVPKTGHLTNGTPVRV